MLKQGLDFFFGQDPRTRKIRLNIIGLSALKGYSIAISFILIPLTLSLLDNLRYGIWITVFNLLSWISLFDIGAGNGLRNRFTESLAKNDSNLAKEYVSTSYFFMTAICMGLIIVTSAFSRFIPWHRMFNIEISHENEIQNLMIITICITCIHFVLKLLGSLLLASHRAFWADTIPALSNTVIILALLFFKKYFHGNLILIGVLYTLIPVLIYIIFHIAFFSKTFYSYLPSVKFIKKNRINSLFNLGMQFFFIQIAGLIIFQSDALIIANQLSPSEVTRYNILFKYFSVIPIIYGVIAVPLWSGYAEAYTLKDFAWIQRTLKTQMKIFILFVIGVVILVLLNKQLISIWLQREMPIDSVMLIGMAIYSIISVWNGIFSALLGGMSKVRLISLLTTISALANIPLSLFLIKVFNNSSGGVIIATSLCIGVTAVIEPIQAYYLLYAKNKTPLLNKIFS